MVQPWKKLKPKLAKANRIAAKHHHSKQLHFHSPKDGIADTSKLSFRSSKADKTSVCHEFSGIDNVATALRVDISSRMLHDAKDLHMIPHGQAKTTLETAKELHGTKNSHFSLTQLR